MNTITTRARRASCLLALAALAGSTALRAQDAASQLDPVVVVATRTPEEASNLGTAVDQISAAELDRQQLTSFAAALGGVPGAPIFANGAPGSDVSLFLRGTDSDQTLFLVDGIRLNDANTDYQVFLGGARPGVTDSIEIARGPQSTLYGSEAVGGVVSIQAQKGSGAPTGDLTLEAGSFSTFGGALDGQGSEQGWSWTVSASGSQTQNQRQNNAFDGANLVLRLDRDVSAAVAVGATIRGFQNRYDDPSDIYTNDLYAYEKESNWLGTIFADLKLAPDWSAHVTVGGQDRRYVSFDELPGVFSETTTVVNRRGDVDAQVTYDSHGAQRITAGFSAESETTQDDGYGDVDQRQTFVGVFAEDEWHPIASTYLTGGVRYDDFDTFGSSVTGRVTAAWLTPDRSIKLRASYGTGFNAPSFLELYGTSVGYQGNPNLVPERSAGGDAGVDWYLPGKKGVVSLSWFRNDIHDLIEYDFSVYPGTTANVDRARTQGIELEAKLEIAAGLQLHAAYTYLDAQDLTEETRLLRRPRNSGSLDLWKDFGGGFSAGGGLVAVAGTQDVDDLTYVTVHDPDYAVARI